MELHAKGDELELIITDDGIGFDVGEALSRAAQGESLGVLGMQERVQLLGGKLDIKSGAGRGTVLNARFPMVPSQPIERRERRRPS